MKNFLLILNIIISISLVVLIMMQGKGAGLGNAWGGSGEMFQTRRGLEKWVLRLTIALTILFFIVSITNLLI
jgi:preprotein translocase subunit SecG